MKKLALLGAVLGISTLAAPAAQAGVIVKYQYAMDCDHTPITFIRRCTAETSPNIVLDWIKDDTYCQPAFELIPSNMSNAPHGFGVVPGAIEEAVRRQILLRYNVYNLPNMSSTQDLSHIYSTNPFPLGYIAGEFHTGRDECPGGAGSTSGGGTPPLSGGAGGGAPLAGGPGGGSPLLPTGGNSGPGLPPPILR